jgi:hypothetical protein
LTRNTVAELAPARAPVEGRRIDLQHHFGARPHPRPIDGIWASDHFGVVVDLDIGKDK